MSVTRFYTRFIPVMLLIAILVTAAFAFAAANTVNDSYAGDGTGTVSGYTVDVSYTLNNLNPANVDSASLTLDQPANTVRVRIYNSTTTAWSSWISCTGSGTTWTCAFPANTEVLPLTQIQVVAAQ